MRMRILGLALAASGLMASVAGAQIVLQNREKGRAPDVKPDIKGIAATYQNQDQGQERVDKRKPPKPPKPPVANNGINYHNGPVMLGTTHIYFIWYGDWSADDTEAILTDEANSIGGTPWYNIATTYYDKTNKHVSNSATFNGSTTDDYSRGKNLTESSIRGIVSDAITSGRLPKDKNGVYFVLTSPEVYEDGFCGPTQGFCGWHTSATLAGLDIKFSFVGGAAQCPNVCTRERSRSPNDNPGADGMASIFAHELIETVTDPDLNAWYDKNGEENADKCAWTFGDIYTAPNGTGANVRWGSRDFLVQRNWVNAGGGSCVVAYP
jgi:hypothetical protein